MHPVLIQFSLLGFSRTIHSYPVMLILALALAIGLGAALARRDGVAGWDGLSVGLLGLAGGLTGATLLDLAVNLPRYLQRPWPPGMVWYGGLAGGLLAAWLFVRRYRLPPGPLLDAAAVSVPLGHGVGRLGCFLGGCCYGRPALPPWPGVIFSDPAAPASMLSLGRIPLHPVQLYEAAALWLLAGTLLAGRRLPALRGRLFGLYLVGYGALRLATETLRGDPARGLWLGGRISTSQLIALLAVMGGALLAARRPAQKRPA